MPAAAAAAAAAAATTTTTTTCDVHFFSFASESSSAFDACMYRSKGHPACGSARHATRAAAANKAKQKGPLDGGDTLYTHASHDGLYQNAHETQSTEENALCSTVVPYTFPYEGDKKRQVQLCMHLAILEGIRVERSVVVARQRAVRGIHLKQLLGEVRPAQGQRVEPGGKRVERQEHL